MVTLFFKDLLDGFWAVKINSHVSSDLSIEGVIVGDDGLARRNRFQEGGICTSNRVAMEVGSCVTSEGRKTGLVVNSANESDAIITMA
jgi:hypothetical protein